MTPEIRRLQIDKLQRLFNIVAHLAHPKGDHCENEEEDEAHDIIRELRAALLAASPVPVERPPDTYHWGETMSQYATLGIGAEAWVELEDIEKRGLAQRNNRKSGMSISWGTFGLVMRVLRAIRLEDFRAPAASPVLQGEDMKEDTRVAPSVVAQEHGDLPRKPQPDGSQRCPKCGFVMCEQFDDKEVGRMTIAVPNGKFICYHCEKKS